MMRVSQSKLKYGRLNYSYSYQMYACIVVVKLFQIRKKLKQSLYIRRESKYWPSHLAQVPTLFTRILYRYMRVYCV